MSSCISKEAVLSKYELMREQRILEIKEAMKGTLGDIAQDKKGLVRGKCKVSSKKLSRVKIREKEIPRRSTRIRADVGYSGMVAEKDQEDGQVRTRNLRPRKDVNYQDDVVEIPDADFIWAVYWVVHTNESKD